MKVKEFFDWIRPLTAIDPETELYLYHGLHHDEFKITQIEISSGEATINIEFDD